MKRISSAIVFCTGCMILNSCEKQTITNGLTTLTPVSVQAKFKMFFWAKPYTYDYLDETVSDGDPIIITLNNKTKNLNFSTYYTNLSGPLTQCPTAFTVSFDLIPGTYTWIATRGNAKVSGSVTIGANSCMFQEVVITH